MKRYTFYMVSTNLRESICNIIKKHMPVNLNFYKSNFEGYSY
jgi:hypothetical protein